ncbi:hypothetical protein STAQ_18860 [Allostella sp. ATCC 35155]|nr:hypothetical protein STAQ_18860 [Stella sp. ATCC 35155]
MLRVRMQHQRDRRIRGAGVGIAAFQAAFRTVDDDFRHRTPRITAQAGRQGPRTPILDWFSRKTYMLGIGPRARRDPESHS